MNHWDLVVEVFLACFIVHCNASSVFPTPSLYSAQSILLTARTTAHSNTNNQPALTSFETFSSYIAATKASGTSNSSGSTLVGPNNGSGANNNTIIVVSSNSSITTSNHSTGNVSAANTTMTNTSSGVTNATTGVPVMFDISSAQSMWMSPTVSITSRVSGDTRTYNSTYFIEFKIDPSHWSSALTTKHNAYINKANRITEKIDQLYVNDTIYDGSYVLGFRKGVYVSIKVKFKPEGGLPSLDALLQFLRAGGEDLKTDQVYIKISQHANCIINYINTRVCHCPSMTYTRQITCQRPDVFGGEDCPERCWTGDTIIGTMACSWDDLDAYECAASSTELTMLLLAICLLVNFWNHRCWK